jgi:hypothetical protein
VPSKFKVGNFGLGQWVVIQRSNLKTMTAERKQKLDAIGFVWNLSNKAWEEGFSKLLKFKKTEGHCNVPRGTMLDHLNLYNWCAVQKRNGNKMVADRKQRLEDIGFIWGATKDKP